MRHVFYIEDWLCIISWILAMTWFSLQITAASNGGGYHQWDITEDGIVRFLKTTYIINVLYSPLIFTVKLSILFMLARFFALYRAWVIFIHIFIAVLAAYTVGATIVKINICKPIDAYWHGTDATNGTCLDILKVFLSDTVFSVITDLTLFALPMTLISVLHLPLIKKLKIIVVLAAGGLVCVVTILRLVWVILYRNSADETWTTERTDMITCAEIAVGIICACLPDINFLVTKSPFSHDQSDERNFRDRMWWSGGYAGQTSSSG